MKYLLFDVIKMIVIIFIFLILLTIAANVSQWIEMNKHFELMLQQKLEAECFPVYDATEEGNAHFVYPCEVKK